MHPLGMKNKKVCMENAYMSNFPACENAEKTLEE